ncbi:SDR family oxidoreductase [Catenulispora sp. NL8]|uniref:SDR family oxidoreductase n=1 Tax=Catenulispora pinistramenti TaxID=2705254 RepID=A0ABS5L6E4_9ACTN|nr:SDR family oxidoreductase [Catenulispora pinistramenti]MBS2553817.1 SDR family oxidoreductase [Catenulispora pinistramenti]
MILVTGASGTLGRVLVPTLTRRGTDVRALSRTPRSGNGPGGTGSFEWVVGDLAAGTGLDEAVDGIDVIVHAASNTRGQGRGDADAVWRLLEAAKRGGRRPHVVYISIVGVDRIPFGYYRIKREAEQTIEASGLPHTIQRTTQWFQLLDKFLTLAAKSPVVPVPAAPFQPLDAAEAATRLADLAGAEPLGHAEDMGGPELLDSSEFAQAYLRATGKRRVLVPFRLPGKAGRAFRAGAHTSPENQQGKTTWAEYLAAEYGAEHGA